MRIKHDPSAEAESFVYIILILQLTYSKNMNHGATCV